MDVLGDRYLKRFWDLLLVYVVSAIAAILVSIGLSGWPLWPLSAGFLLIFPGYLLTCLFFPKQESLPTKDRLILASVLSIAIIPIIGFVLNYTADLKGSTIVLFVLAFNLAISLVLTYARLQYAETYSPPFIPHKVEACWSALKNKGRFEKTMVVLSTVMLVACLVAVIFIVNNPDSDPSSEFYLLADDGSIINFPNNVTVGEDIGLIVGVVNHEGRIVNYTVQAWLIQSEVVEGQASVQHMWFQESLSVELGSIKKEVVDEHQTQWEQEITLAINTTGEYRIWFFLFLEPVDGDLVPGMDYADTTYEELVQQALDNQIYNLYLDILVIP